MGWRKRLVQTGLWIQCSAPKQARRLPTVGSVFGFSFAVALPLRLILGGSGPVRRRLQLGCLRRAGGRGAV